MLIVGLGNPGAEYEETYHNLGFLAIDRLAAAHGIRMTRAEGKAITGVGRIAGADVVLAKPQTYMNLSGGSVKELLGKYMLPEGTTVSVRSSAAWERKKLRGFGWASARSIP
jgi:PTH1 family peptidyl-tRNA hydrolase